jgi:hypothetical protein
MGRRVLLNKTLPTAYGSRFLGIYFRDIREHESSLAKEKIDYEVSKRDSMAHAKNIPPNDSKIDALLEGLHREGEVQKLHKKIEELEERLKKLN